MATPSCAANTRPRSVPSTSSPAQTRATSPWRSTEWSNSPVTSSSSTGTPCSRPLKACSPPRRSARKREPWPKTAGSGASFSITMRCAASTTPNPASSNDVIRSPMQVFRGRVVTPTEIIDDGALAAESGTLTYVGSWEGAPEPVRTSEVAPAPEQYLLPGLVDVHNHGGGGVSFPDTERVEDVARGVAEHQAHGTMRMLASLVTASAETLRERVSLLADAADAGIIAGIHLEGPFISHAR